MDSNARVNDGVFSAGDVRIQSTNRVSDGITASGTITVIDGVALEAMEADGRLNG